MTKNLLDDVDENIPAVVRAEILQKKAAIAGFDWVSSIEIFNKIEEEINEIKIALNDKQDKSNLSEEIGDLIFCCINLARHYQVNPELALQGTNNKFIKRFNFIEDSLKRGGVSIFDASVEDMEKLWNKAKTETI